jgi:hypothetical protein
MNSTRIFAMVFLGLVIGIGMAHLMTAGATSQSESIYITDRTGERWDITQAVSLGFRADRFQYGIGRDAIRPLDKSSLSNKTSTLDETTRVIGVENGPDAHAYVVRKLTRHEIANTRLGDTPIAAAY